MLVNRLCFTNVFLTACLKDSKLMVFWNPMVHKMVQHKSGWRNILPAGVTGSSSVDSGSPSPRAPAPSAALDFEPPLLFIWRCRSFNSDTPSFDAMVSDSRWESQVPSKGFNPKP